MMVSDLELQQRVMEELAFEPSVDAAHIGVSVHQGVVTLSGHVASYTEKLGAERAARRVRGVAAVAQDLEVHLPTDAKTADDEIAARAVQILRWDVTVPDERIAITVERGTVRLSGEVEWDYQRRQAEYDVLRLTGVKAILNEIVLKPRLHPVDLRATIRGALERIADRDAGRIVIDVSEHRVVLRGVVESWGAREAIERAAWAAPGVSQVDNRIEVVPAD